MEDRDEKIMHIEPQRSFDTCIRVKGIGDAIP